MYLQRHLCAGQQQALSQPVTWRFVVYMYVRRKGIDKQIMVCEGLLEGKDVVRDQYTGRKIPQWFWRDDSGSYYLSINYGKSPIELAKGKFSIVCNGWEQVKSSLETVKSSVSREIRYSS